MVRTGKHGEYEQKCITDKNVSVVWLEMLVFSCILIRKSVKEGVVYLIKSRSKGYLADYFERVKFMNIKTPMPKLFRVQDIGAYVSTRQGI